VAFVTLCIVASGLRFSTTATPQQVTFRSGVDLVAVDTQVIDRDGAPISNLGVDKFEVWINGQPRKVVSADLIQYPLQTPRNLIDAPVDTPGVERTDLPPVNGRVIVLAIDEMSFSFQALPDVLQTVKRFLGTLAPEDIVAAFPYPFGSGRIDLTHYHNQISVQLSRVQGMKTSDVGGMGGGDLFLSPSEIVDIASNDSSALQSAYQRECLVSNVGAVSAATGISRNDAQSSGNGCVDRDSGLPPNMGSQCALRLKAQANGAVGELESAASESFNGMRTLLQGLKAISGPKVVVLVSAGLTTADRAGGRPDISGIMSATGELAAAANAMVYVMHFDGNFLNTFSANGARNTYNPCQTGLVNASTTQPRDEQLSAVGLERIAGQAGGEYFRITAGNGDSFFNRVLKETSAYYVLGVQPEQIDRDGRTHFIRVKTTDVKNATVRFRSQVTIPKTDGK